MEMYSSSQTDGIFSTRCSLLRSQGKSHLYSSTSLLSEWGIFFLPLFCFCPFRWQWMQKYCAWDSARQFWFDFLWFSQRGRGIKTRIKVCVKSNTQITDFKRSKQKLFYQHKQVTHATDSACIEEPFFFSVENLFYCFFIITAKKIDEKKRQLTLRLKHATSPMTRSILNPQYW